jgi:hypothetical protein
MYIGRPHIALHTYARRLFSLLIFSDMHFRIVFPQFNLRIGSKFAKVIGQKKMQLPVGGGYSPASMMSFRFN